MSDSDFGPGESPSLVVVRTGRTRVSRKRPAPAPAPSRNVDTDRQASEQRRQSSRHDELTEAADDDNCCYLCLAVAGGKMEEWRSRSFHHRCRLAIRCHLRVAKKAGGDIGVSKAIERFERNPTRWRDDVKPLIADFGGTRSSAARRLVKLKVQETTAFKEESTIKDISLMTKRRFKSYVGFWDKVASSEASEDFDDRLEVASTQNEDSDGEPRIAVRENEKLRKREGTTRSTRTQIQEGDGAPSRQGRDGRSSCRRSGRVETPRMPRKHGSRRARCDSDAESRRLSEDGDSCADEGIGREPRSETKGASARSMGGSSVKAARSRSSRRETESQPLASPSAHTSEGRPRDRADRADRASGSRGSAKVSPLELMKKKDALKASVADVVKQVAGEKGLAPTLLSTAARECRTHREKLGDTAQAKHDALVAKLQVVQTLQARIDAARDSNFGELSAKITEAIDDCSKAMQDAEDHLAAAKYLFDVDKAGVRAAQQQVGHRKRKLAGKLNPTKFGAVKVYSRVGWCQTSFLLGRRCDSGNDSRTPPKAGRTLRCYPHCRACVGVVPEVKFEFDLVELDPGITHQPGPDGGRRPDPTDPAISLVLSACIAELVPRGGHKSLVYHSRRCCLACRRGFRMSHAVRRKRTYVSST